MQVNKELAATIRRIAKERMAGEFNIHRLADLYLAAMEDIAKAIEEAPDAIRK